MVKYNNIYQFCGSCNCMRMFLDDCPATMPFDVSEAMTKETAQILNKRYPIRWDHHLVLEKYEKLGKPLKEIKWRAVIYNRNTGENASQSEVWMRGKKKNKDRFHPIAFIRSLNLSQYKYKSNKIKSEFNLIPIINE